MKKRSGEARGVHFGGPTVLTVLLSLVFACLSLLALSRAGTDHRLTVRTAQTTADYYAAEGKAEEILSRLAEDCAAAPADAGAAMVQTARDAGASTAAYEQTTGEVRFSVPAGTQGSYETVLRLTAAGNGTAFSVQSACIRPADDAAQDSLPVYQSST